MRSETARVMDRTYDRLHWAGVEYIFNSLLKEGEILPAGDNQYPAETLYWIGYAYRYWHFRTGESCEEIIRQAPAALMRTCCYSNGDFAFVPPAILSAK
jgi:hypothetical protein